MTNLYDLLVERKFLSEDARARVEEYAAKWNMSPFQSILETNLLDETSIADCLAEDLGLNRVYHLDSAAIELDAIRQIPYAIAKEFEILPLMYLDEDKKMLEVVYADPFCKGAEQFISQSLSCNVAKVIGERSDILKAIDQYYPIDMQIPSLKVN